MNDGKSLTKSAERAPIIHADVGIIGAGPAGLATAVRLAQLGASRVVLVDRAGFPRDKTCGSAVSPKGCELLKELGIELERIRESYPINGLRLVTPRGCDVAVSSPQDVAFICNRRIFDHFLLKQAQAAGTNFLDNFEATHLLQRGDRVVGFRSSDGREVRAEYTVVADGAHSRLACERGPRQLIQAIMGWWEGVSFNPHQVEMIFDDLISPYYGWLFPESPNRVNIGICYEDPRLEHNARELFQRFLDKHYSERLRSAHQLGSWKGHPISYATSVRRLTSPGRLIVGEAGRIAHPATAEGIYQGLRSGTLAAQALYDILKRRVNPSRGLRGYERACRKSFGLSFRGATLWRGLVAGGGLDIATFLMSRPTSRRLLARLMAQM